MGWIHAGTGGAGSYVMDDPLGAARHVASLCHNDAVRKIQASLAMPKDGEVKGGIYDWRSVVEFGGLISVSTLINALAIKAGQTRARSGRQLTHFPIPQELRPQFEAALAGLRRLEQLLGEIQGLHDPSEIRRKAEEIFCG